MRKTPANDVRAIMRYNRTNLSAVDIRMLSEVVQHIETLEKRVEENNQEDMTNWHKLKRHLTTALDNPPPHTDKATIAQVLFIMATMEETNGPQPGDIIIPDRITGTPETIQWKGRTYTLKEETQ